MELYALTDNMILEKIGENIKRMRLEHNIPISDNRPHSFRK